jgi:hypothetical protein
LICFPVFHNTFILKYCYFVILKAITNSPGIVGAQQVGIAQQQMGLRPAVSATQPATVSAVGIPSSVSKESKVLDKRRLQELVKEVDPLEQLDEDVEEVLKKCLFLTFQNSISF